MRWDESLLLFDLFFESLLLGSSVVAGALSQALLQFWALADVNKDLVAFVEEAESEGTETDLNNSSVVNDLDSDWLLGDSGSKMSFHDQVTGFKVTVVNSMMESLQKSCPNLESVGTVIQNLSDKLLNDLLGWSREEINLLKGCWFVLKSFSGLGIQ